MTKIDLPAPWDDTDIDYYFPSTGGAIQTITKGDAETVVTYDSMFRTRLEQTKALDTGWESFVNTKYDALGRVIFTSQPSASEFETKGTDTIYDGLGRMLSATQNVSPFAATTYDYLPEHATRVTDPDGNATTTYKDCLLYTSPSPRDS